MRTKFENVAVSKATNQMIPVEMDHKVNCRYLVSLHLCSVSFSANQNTKRTMVVSVED